MSETLLSRVSAGGNAMNFEYFFDPNGNVTQINDYVAGTPTEQHRYMQYDALDRLTGTGSQMFGGDHWHRYTYDALDNLTSSKLAGVKEHNYDYDSNNRLSMVRNNAGAATIALGYDVQGNLSFKNAQDYSFDYGNRLRAVAGKETYRYDGQGRRVMALATGKGPILSMYSQSGQVVYQHNDRESKGVDHVYLGGSLIATLDRMWATGATVTKYHHTDALGSPVATTDSGGQVVDRTKWEPYGAAIGKTISGVGYTGHVMDGETGLTYMQQRYYDPTLGRFLSVDPVTADSNTGGNFNRYWYANNSPYKFTDPDGRVAFLIPVGIFILKEVAGEVFEQTTGIPAPTVKNAGKAAVKQVARAARAANAARGRASEARKLAEIGATKNTAKVATSTGDRIRDGTKADGTHVEIKDKKRVDNTAQLRGLDEAAGKDGQRLELHTGEQSNVSRNVNERTLPNTDVIKWKDLGPGS